MHRTRWIDVSRGRRLLALCLPIAALAAGCGGDSKQSGGNGPGGGGGAGGDDCKDPDKALTKAAREHVGALKVATDGAAGSVDRITVDVCAKDEEATAVVVVYGMPDKAIRDVRHQLRLIKVGGLWQVTDDIDTQSCQPGHGPQKFSSEVCQ